MGLGGALGSIQPWSSLSASITSFRGRFFFLGGGAARGGGSDADGGAAGAGAGAAAGTGAAAASASSPVPAANETQAKQSRPTLLVRRLTNASMPLRASQLEQRNNRPRSASVVVTVSAWVWGALYSSASGAAPLSPGTEARHFVEQNHCPRGTASKPAQ